MTLRFSFPAKSILVFLGLMFLITLSVDASIELTLLAHANYQNALDSLIEQYNTLQDEVIIRPLYIANGANVYQKFITMAVGGVAPEILWHFYTADLASMDLVVSLETYIARDKERDSFIDDFIGGLAQRYMYQDEIYAISFGVNAGYMVLYSKEKIAEAGLPEPEGLSTLSRTSY